MRTPQRPSNPYQSPTGRPGFGRSRPGRSAAQVYQRPTLVTVLSVLNFIGAPMCFLLAVFLNFAAQQGEPDAVRVLQAVALLYVVLGFVSFLAGIGLWSLKSYGRKLQIASAVFGLFGFPLGTIISVAILVYFFKPGTKALFSEKPVAQLTELEIAEITKLQQGSGALVVVLALVIPIVLVAFIGIVAAIAIPSLLRARVAANEASAIGNLRQVVSAEMAYAQANGGQYDTLECLAMPSECIPAYDPAGPRFLASAPATTYQGYRFEFHPGAPSPENDVAFGNLSPSSITGFAFIAYPENAGVTGARGFCADYTGQMCVTLDGSAPAVTNVMCAPGCTPLQ